MRIGNLTPSPPGDGWELAGGSGPSNSAASPSPPGPGWELAGGTGQRKSAPPKGGVKPARASLPSSPSWKAIGGHALESGLVGAVEGGSRFDEALADPSRDATNWLPSAARKIVEKNQGGGFIPYHLSQALGIPNTPLNRVAKNIGMYGPAIVGGIEAADVAGTGLTRLLAGPTADEIAADGIKNLKALRKANYLKAVTAVSHANEAGDHPLPTGIEYKVNVSPKSKEVPSSAAEKLEDNRMAIESAISPGFGENLKMAFPNNDSGINDAYDKMVAAPTVGNARALTSIFNTIKNSSEISPAQEALLTHGETSVNSNLLKPAMQSYLREGRSTSTTKNVFKRSAADKLKDLNNAKNYPILRDNPYAPQNMRGWLGDSLGATLQHDHAFGEDSDEENLPLTSKTRQAIELKNALGKNFDKVFEKKFPLGTEDYGRNKNPLNPTEAYKNLLDNQNIGNALEARRVFLSSANSPKILKSQADVLRAADHGIKNLIIKGLGDYDAQNGTNLAGHYLAADAPFKGEFEIRSYPELDDLLSARSDPEDYDPEKVTKILTKAKHKGIGIASRDNPGYHLNTEIKNALAKNRRTPGATKKLIKNSLKILGGSALASGGWNTTNALFKHLF